MAKTTTTDLTPIGDVVRAWRMFRGFSSTQLADKAGVRLSYLSEIEHNRTINPKAEYLEKLALTLEVPLEDIYGRRMPAQGGGAGATSSSQQKGGEEGAQKRATPSIVYHTPLALQRQKLLRHQIAVLKKKFEAIEKNVHTALEELSELEALAESMFAEEDNDAPPPATGSV